MAASIKPDQAPLLYHPEKLHRYEVHTRLITRDHVPRRADQCNLHTHVIANKNKSPVEKSARCEAENRKSGREPCDSHCGKLARRGPRRRQRVSDAARRLGPANASETKSTVREWANPNLNTDLSQIPQSQFQSSLSCRPLYSYQRYQFAQYSTRVACGLQTVLSRYLAAPGGVTRQWEPEFPSKHPPRTSALVRGVGQRRRAP